MSEITWLFVIGLLALTFPVLMVTTNNYFNNTPEEIELDSELPSGTWVNKILDWLKINDFIDSMSNIPQPLRSIIYSIWIMMLIYVIVKALPFT